QSIVDSPWQSVIDSSAPHGALKELIRATIDGCTEDPAERCLTLVAQAGYGKTHLLAYGRQLTDEWGGIFVFVPPFASNTPAASFEQHLMRSAFEALNGRRSQRQRERFGEAVRSQLVAAYDRVVEAGDGQRILQTGTWLQWSFTRNSLRIARKPAEQQLASLR